MTEQGTGATEGGGCGSEGRWQRLPGSDEEEEIKVAAEEGLAVVEAARKRRRGQRGLTRPATEGRKGRGGGWRQLVGGRGEDAAGSEGRRQWLWSTMAVATATTAATIFLEEETRATIIAAGGRGWEQKAGAVGERRRDLVRAVREGREMAGMAGCGGKEERNRGGQRRKRRPRERAAAIYDDDGDNGDDDDDKRSDHRVTVGTPRIAALIPY
ncbi:hypothetical protein B296_00029042 [Ensete ventricosum]|uniref:Uncharacterized protein n=1 Tax=Ensete ventricosum TaxID=4639 RepID=A0A426XY68_ENSVE|nr:hypothetical protein B296_00029042 [Ensete ventricosum]